jgi:hypothetical protein
VREMWRPGPGGFAGNAWQLIAHFVFTAAGSKGERRPWRAGAEALSGRDLPGAARPVNIQHMAP